jgi:hypothetical protein
MSGKVRPFKECECEGKRLGIGLACEDGVGYIVFECQSCWDVRKMPTKTLDNAARALGLRGGGTSILLTHSVRDVGTI